MQQFWYTISKNKNSSSYQFQLDNQKFEIEAELFCKILHITQRVPNQEFIEPHPYDDLVSFIKQHSYMGSLELVSELYIDLMYQPWRTLLNIINRCISGKSLDLDRFQIDSRQTSAKRREQMPYPRLTKVIIKYFLSKHNSIPKRHNSFINTIKYDAILGKLKFISKGEEHQKYGMSIPDSMMNDEIKDSIAYLTYIALSTNTELPKVGKCKGKGPIRKKKAVTSAPKTKKRKNAPRKKSFITANDNILPDPDEALKLADTAKSEETEDDEVQPLIQSDEEKADEKMKDTKNKESEKDEEERADKDEKADDEQARINQARDKEPVDDQVGSKQAGSAQTNMVIPEPTVRNLSSGLKLSSAEYGNKFLNISSDTSLVGILKDPAEIEIQLMVDVPIHASKSNSSLKFEERLSELEKEVKALLKIDHSKVIKESVQANVTNEVRNQVPKLILQVVSDLIKPRMESTVRDVIQKTPIHLTQPSSTSAKSLTEYELKIILLDKMQKCRSFQTHEKHLDLYNALVNLTMLDEAITSGDVNPSKSFEKESPNDQSGSTPKGKTQSKPSSTDKFVNAEEIIHDVALETDQPMDVEEDEVVNVKDQWQKEPNVDDGPEQTWFHDLVNAEENPLTFDNLMGSTIDFTKFAQNRLKKDKITKADLQDWVNPEGDIYPFDLSKPLPLQDYQGQLIILTKAARYELVGIEEIFQGFRAQSRRLMTRMLNWESISGDPNISYSIDLETMPHHVIKSSQD
ncbi:hypothetical protein Tco_1102752 [Tanacetum coccineum]